MSLHATARPFIGAAIETEAGEANKAASVARYTAACGKPEIVRLYSNKSLTDAWNQALELGDLTNYIVVISGPENGKSYLSGENDAAIDDVFDAAEQYGWHVVVTFQFEASHKINDGQWDKDDVIAANTRFYARYAHRSTRLCYTAVGDLSVLDFECYPGNDVCDVFAWDPYVKVPGQMFATRITSDVLKIRAHGVTVPVAINELGVYDPKGHAPSVAQVASLGIFTRQPLNLRWIALFDAKECRFDNDPERTGVPAAVKALTA